MAPHIRGNRKITVCLIKPEYSSDEEIIHQRSDVQKKEISTASGRVGTLYFKNSPPKPPKWLSFFSTSISASEKRKFSTKNIAAALVLKVHNRLFVITFGYGRSLLVPGTWEERFGLKAALNSVDPNKLRVIDRKTLDAMITHTRSQTSKKCSLGNFGIDTQQVLLKAVTGEPQRPEFASSVCGADFLSITCTASDKTISEKCEELLSIANLENYKTNFSWVDNIVEISDHQKIDELNQKLIERIKQYLHGEHKSVFLAVPEIMDWSAFRGFRFSRHGETYDDLALDKFLASLRDPESISMEMLKKRDVFEVHEDIEVKKWKVLQCVNCEIEDEGRTIILTEGRWYAVDLALVNELRSQLNRIPLERLPFIARKGETEPAFCKYAHESARGEYALMDRGSIFHGGGRSQIEFCDLYHRDGTMIHFKRYGCSSVLSHLFSQGLVSAQLCSSDPEFLRKVNEKLPTSHKFTETSSWEARNHKIIFGIISTEAEKIPHNLPLFSRLTLVNAWKNLASLGYAVSVCGIPVRELR